MRVVQGFEPSATALTTADYDLAGTINSPIEGVDAGERKDISSVSTSAYLTFNLNSTGRNWVAKTSFTKLALREGHDVIDSPFVGSKNQYNRIQFRTGEYSGTAYDPVLEVTYQGEPQMDTITYVYDTAGQRVKIVNGGVTTVYPTANYNTDGTQAIKHIMANGVVATVKGTGATAVPYYVATDHLTGSNVVTTSTGTQEELMDYYPFGAIRLDEKAGTFSEQRKFTGQEYDVDTGLSYMNARYYNGTIGRFISQDPLEIVGFQTTDANKFVQVISSPQNWNTYSYALNNPLVAIDPSGLIPYFVPGFAAPGLPRSTANDQNISQTLSWMTTTFGSQVEFFAWSQRDNTRAFNSAAQGLANKVVADYTGREPIDLVGHSDGGIVAGKAAQILVGYGFPVRNLIMGGTPIRAGDFDVSGVQNVVMSFNSDDSVQVSGGNAFTASGMLGGLAGSGICGPACGTIGLIIGSLFGKGEFGPAGRTISGANNFNATSTINDVQSRSNGLKGPVYEHSATIFESAVQKQLENYIRK